MTLERCHPALPTAPCRGCGKPILWAKDAAGKAIPLDPRAVIYRITGYEASDAGAGPGPSERVRELIRLNPEAAASVLHRWTGQGGPNP